LESLESYRFDDLPSGVFVRGFIKAYASAVDIDAEEVLARFDEERPEPTLPPPPVGIQRSRGSGLLVAVTTAVLFAIIVVTFAMVRRAPAQNEPIELSSAPPWRAEPDRAVPYSSARSTIGTPTESSPS
jgi:cytoskeletal protein RodZ